MLRTSLLLLIWLAFLHSAAAFHVTYVVSVCKEKRLSFIDTSIKILRAGGRNHSVQVVYYCKCGQDRTVDGRHCHNLPNFGREAHTYFTHIVDKYNYTLPSKEHVFFFVNGGAASKEHAVRNVFTIARQLGVRDSAPAFVDDYRVLSHEERLAQRHIEGTNAQFVAEATAHCFVAGNYSNYRPEKEVFAETPRKCPCPSGPQFCELFAPVTCPVGSRLLFQPQLNCHWIGMSRGNYDREKYDPTLRAADPPAFTDWMYERWGINAYTWAARGWACCGNFAVSAATVKDYPLPLYERVLEEFGGTGQAGGAVGFFFERAWRAIFTVPPAAALLGRK